MHTDLRKAAVLFSRVSERDSARLIGALDAEDGEKLAAAVRALDQVTEDECQQIAADLVDRQYHKRQTTAQSNPCEKVARVSSGNNRAPNWDTDTQQILCRLQDAPTAWLSRRLSQELPQTAAVVLCHLSPQRAADVLASFSTEFQIRVTERLSGLSDIDDATIRELFTALARQFHREELRNVAGQGGLPFVAQVVKRLDRATEKALLENLAQNDRALVDQLLKLVFMLRDRDTSDAETRSSSPQAA